MSHFEEKTIKKILLEVKQELEIIVDGKQNIENITVLNTSKSYAVLPLLPSLQEIPHLNNHEVSEKMQY